MKTSFFRKFAFVFFVLFGFSVFISAMSDEIFFFSDVLTVINFPSSIFYNFVLAQNTSWWQQTFYSWIDSSIGATIAFVVMVFTQAFLLTTFLTIIFKRQSL
jgi:hypothetical protein